MVRRAGQAGVVCIIMVLTAIAPLAIADDHLVVKGSNGPRASAVSWSFELDSPGTYSAEIDNYGLRWLVLEIFDNTSGFPDLVLHQKIRFAEYGAFPTGTVYSGSVAMAGGHAYLVTATPNGRESAYAVVTDSFVVSSPPVAAFVWWAEYLTAFTDASSSSDQDGVIVDYIWDWGDGTTSSGKEASHTYAGCGYYLITLTVVDDWGMTDNVTHEFLLPCPGMPPTAEFSLTISYMTVQVDASASTADGWLVAYDWDFGDGSTGTGWLANHTYATGGLFIITLVVTDDDGRNDSKSMGIQIPTPFPPVAWFSYEVSGLTVVCDGTGSYDPDGLIASYEWSWGDGTTGYGATTTHTFASPGLYVISLTVTDDWGYSDTMSTNPVSIG